MNGKLSAAIRASWEDNACLWLRAVEEAAIPSRRAGSSDAVVKIIEALGPARLLDVGCGEGWLLRQASRLTGCSGLGFDGVAVLVENAKRQDPSNEYLLLSYEDFVRTPCSVPSDFDVAVFNYSIFHDAAKSLLAATRSRLKTGGRIVIQTLHPLTVAGGEGYADGWRSEDFRDFDFGSWAAMPWYFRTISSWVRIVSEAGFSIQAIHEPTAAGSKTPLSLILVAASGR